MPHLRLIPSGVPGLDPILGGGFPEYSLNLVFGGPGMGKTTLVNQILFANATEERPALFITLAGEPPIKMLRYQHQFSFFDADGIGRVVHILNLADEAMAGDTDALLGRTEAELKRFGPALVAVDSLGTVEGLSFTEGAEARRHARAFVRRLAMCLTRWEATTFLVGEFDSEDLRTSPIQTLADGAIRLLASAHEDAVSRKLEVVKQRGLRQVPGLHPFRITAAGLRVYMLEDDRQNGAEASPVGLEAAPPGRLSFGVAGLDEMTGGGVPAGDAVMISGPSGVGKSVLAMHFVQAGLDAGESVVVALFEEDSRHYIDRAAKLGLGFPKAVEDGRLHLYRRSLRDLSVAEAFVDISSLVEQVEARRLIIDSLTGMEVSVSDPSERRVQEAMYRSARALTRQGITALLLSEVGVTMNVVQLTPHRVSVLADDLIMLRYVEIMGELQTVIAVVKMRRSDHSKVFHRYEVRDDGFHVGRVLRDFHGVITGVPQLRGEPEQVFDEDDHHERPSIQTGATE